MILAVRPIERVYSPVRRWALLCGSGPVRALLLALTLVSLANPIPLRADDDPPFEIDLHEIPGRIVQVWPLAVGPCPGKELDLLVLSVEGAPPTQDKIVTWMPCGSATEPGHPAIVHQRLPPDTVLVDVARVPGRSGPQRIGVTATGVTVVSLIGNREPTLRWPVPGGLPMPPRPRKISRLEIVGDWDSNGRPSALIPAFDGGRLVDLSTGAVRRLPMPVFADYVTWEPYLPATVWKWMIQETTWPSLSRADDNGDGRLDLFAMSRWGIWIYHAGPEGLPPEPSRRIELLPFDEETERRHQATGISYFARDLDGDDRADLLLSTVAGGLMDGRSSLKIYLNDGKGVDPGRRPVATREIEGGFSGIFFADIDNDGRTEIIEAVFEFGVVQTVRILLTRRAETKLRVLRLDPEAPDGLRADFEDDLSFRLNFGESSITGLIPALGDWNGDRVLDFFVPRGANEIGFRMGSTREGKPLFGRVRGEQKVPLSSGETRVGDLDGDGLDEIVAFSLGGPEDPLVVLHNRGRLPGTRPEIDAPR